MLNHRLVYVTFIDSAPRYPGKPYRIRRVDGLNWVFPAVCGDGRIRGVNLPEVWCTHCELLPVDNLPDPVPAVAVEVSRCR